MFEVPMPKTAPDAVTEVLIKHQNDPRAIEIYDSKYGPGAADLEIRRARRKGSP